MNRIIEQAISSTVTIETSGTWGIEGLNFVKEIGQRTSRVSQNTKSTAFLIQRISITLQHGNVASILGTLPRGMELEEIFHLQVSEGGKKVFVLGQWWRPQQPSIERAASNNLTAKRSAEYA
ncbi:hypothetical protein C0J52_24067 [Blattella germanica]|nr:hypothetical protein C0J52_24067 [Blattella germanica]